MKKASLFCKWKAILAAGALAHGLRRRIVALAVPLAAIFAAFLPAAAQAQAVPNVQWSSINPIQMAIDTPYTVALTLTNNGNQVADDGLINVSLPTGITLSGAPPAGCTATATGFSCSLATLAGGSFDYRAPNNVLHLTFQIVASAPVHGGSTLTGKISNVTHGGHGQTNYTDLTVPITATGAPDLKSTISGTTTPMIVGTPEVYTVTVVNQGNEPSADGTVTITLPGDVTVDAATLPAYCSAAGAEVTCTPLPGLNPGDEEPIALTLTATAALTSESITVKIANVTDEIDTSNNITTAELNAVPTPAAPQPNLTSTIDGPQSLTVGEPQLYNVTVTNLGGEASTNGTLTITLGSDMTGTIDQAALPAGVSCTLNAANTVFDCALTTTIAPNGSVMIPVEVTATNAFASGVITAGIQNVVPAEEIEENEPSESSPITARNPPPPPLPPGGGVANVPTLNETALTLLALLMAGATVVRLRRRQS